MRLSRSAESASVPAGEITRTADPSSGRSPPKPFIATVFTRMPKRSNWAWVQSVQTRWRGV